MSAVAEGTPWREDAVGVPPKGVDTEDPQPGEAGGTRNAEGGSVGWGARGGGLVRVEGGEAAASLEVPHESARTWRAGGEGGAPSKTTECESCMLLGVSWRVLLR